MVIYGETALHSACYSGSLSAIKKALKQGAEVNARNDSWMTPLHLLCTHDNTKALRLLLKHGARVNAVATWGGTPLYLSCHHGRKNMMKLLLGYGADPALLSDLPPHKLSLVTNYLAELEAERRQERLYAMVVLEKQRGPYFVVADIGSIVTAFL